MDLSLVDAIIAGERVGKYVLGITLEELLQIIDAPYKLTETIDIINIDCEDINFFIWKKTNRLTTITVFDNFKGKYLNEICIGSSLEELEGKVIEGLEFDSMENEYTLDGITFSFINEKGTKQLEYMVIWTGIEN
ncbi:hypothetical protein I6N90_05200 [Paenibacillus sp. GSMTC-2017]|uniref:hypothetical protein n=1 Tax=Paenibacillus sp. GSMTC-2017 TaxID=2794350 RepID=UPI0018D88C01|nr:hypothetical protein [Paenibacillus sp. GSMTC-2017]MBH5317205.1 hypothetical protein [Paenibacillus sp. GSMTC-2017]